jgi:DNA polymerase-3 subunit delta
MTTEASYNNLSEILAEIQRGNVAPIYLLYGDEFLCKSAFKPLLDAIVPPKEQTLNYEALDGATASIHEAVERLNTFPLLPCSKVIAVHDTQVFYSKVTVDELLTKSKEAFEKEDLKGAARCFLQMLSATGLSLETVGHEDLEKLLDKAFGDRIQTVKTGAGTWLDQVVDYCLREQMKAPANEDEGDVLSDAIIAGFPKTNHLFLTTEFVDKRRKLYKAIKKIGVVIDCSIAQGERAADKREQKEILKAHMKKTLTGVGKTMAPRGFEALYEKTGASLRSFSNEMEKLIAFVGDRNEILVDDVQQASNKSKQDPIYELANAIGERNSQKALFYVDSLLEANLFPLQILSSPINQVRKMILAKDFIRSSSGESWKTGMNYGTFQRAVWPELDKRKGDLLTGNAHPYAVYMTLVHSENYSYEELAKAMETLLDTDLRLKTSGQDAKLVLEHGILQVCGMPVDASTNFPGRLNPLSESSSCR